MQDPGSVTPVACRLGEFYYSNIIEDAHARPPHPRRLYMRDGLPKDFA